MAEGMRIPAASIQGGREPGSAARRGRAIEIPKKRAHRALRRAVDAMLTAVLLFVMATPLAEETAHEWLGIATAVLSIVHAAANARVLRGILRGGFAFRRVVFVAVDLLMALCLVALIASSLVLSVHAFSWLPVIPGASWARPLHMLCSFWLFVLTLFHAGLHVRWRASRLPRPLIGAIALAAAVGGAAAFIWLDLGLYLLGQVPFYAVDVSQPLALRVVAYALVGALVALIGSTIRWAMDASHARGSVRGKAS